MYVLKQGERCKTHIHLGQAMGKGNFEKLMQILTEWCKTKSKIIMTAPNQNQTKHKRSSIHWKLRVKWLQLISHLHLVRWEGDIHSLNYSERNKTTAIPDLC